MHVWQSVRPGEAPNEIDKDDDLDAFSTIKTWNR